MSHSGMIIYSVIPSLIDEKIKTKLCYPHSTRMTTLRSNINSRKKCNKTVINGVRHPQQNYYRIELISRMSTSVKARISLHHPLGKSTGVPRAVPQSQYFAQHLRNRSRPRHLLRRHRGPGHDAQAGGIGLRHRGVAEDFPGQVFGFAIDFF